MISEGQPKGLYNLSEKALKGASPLEARVMNNFYLTFMFSQANPGQQRRLMYVLTKYYDPEEFQKEFASTTQLNERLEPRVRQLHLPFLHSSTDEKGDKITKNEIGKEFQKQWEIQRYLLSSVVGDSRLQPERIDESLFVSLQYTPHNDLLVRIANTMAIRDMDFIKKGRPNRDGSLR